MARGTRIARLALLVSSGLCMCQVACRSQTAIAIVAAGADAADLPVSPADGGDGVADALLEAPGSDAGADRGELPVDAVEAPGDAVEAPADLVASADLVPDVTPRDLPAEVSRDVVTGPVVLFSDAFDGGYEVNWLLSESSDGPVRNARDGSNPIVTLDSTATDWSRLRCNLGGDKFTQTDIAASMRIRVDAPPSSTRSVRLDVRQSAETANVFYAVGAVVGSDGAITKISIFKKVPDGNGDYTICQLAEGAVLATPIALGQWRRIKLTISGTRTVHLTAFFEDLQMATFTDDCAAALTATNGAVVANGGCLPAQTGLGIQVEKGLQASVDDVLVTTL